jgi:amino acid permease
MIQRIQSVYLLLAAIAIGLTAYFPLADAIGAKDSLVLYTYKISSLVPDGQPDFPSYFIWPIAIISALVFIVSIVTIFLYKKRMQQLNILRIAVILLLVMIALFFFYYSPELERASGGLVGYQVPGAYLPVISFILFILAYRGIIADEKLIRSADRLR